MADTVYPAQARDVSAAAPMEESRNQPDEHRNQPDGAAAPMEESPEEAAGFVTRIVATKYMRN